MSELIDRQAAIDTIKDADVCVCYSENEPVEIENVIDLAIRATKGSVIASIEQMPSAQPKIGKWIKIGHIEHTYLISRCSACGYQTIDAGNYCTNCGAKMEG